MQDLTPTEQTSTIRPSRAGYTLLSLVLEDLVLNRLPQPTPAGKSTPVSRLTSAMSIGTGFLFEKELVPLLKERFPEYTLVEQPKLTWGNYSGTGDFLLHNSYRNHALIIDAKAFRADTLRDIRERKLTDSWSYPSQLAIYHMAAQEQLGDNTQVDAWWYIWSVSKGKLFTVEQTFDKSEKLANAAARRLELYTLTKVALENNAFESAARLVCNKASECILPKSWFFGNLCAGTRFHYHPYSDLFFPEQDPDSEDYGQPLQGESLCLLVERLMHDAYSPDQDLSFYKNYLLTKGYTLD